MKLSKKQIILLKKEFKNADIAERKLAIATQGIAKLIFEFTGINGNVDLLPGDGFGFTIDENSNIHISISQLIESAELGEDINETFILKNSSF